MKGLAATRLYGERGINGVILITTKNAAARTTLKKTEITVTQSLYSSTVANLPEWQNTYGGGFHQSEGFAFFSNWGAAFANPPHLLNHPYSRPGTAALSLRYQSSFPDLQGQKVAFQAAPNNVKDFFRIGWVSTSSLNIACSPLRYISTSATSPYFSE